MTPDQIDAIVDDMIDQLENRDWGSIEIKRYFKSKVAAAVAAEHARTIEQAAKVAEEFECDTYEDGWAEMERGARHCAAAIRALK